MKKSIVFFFFFLTSTYGQISGCTDTLAKNFEPNATINNGSCFYEQTTLKPTTSLILSDSIFETSGLIYFDDLLWTHNDDRDTTIYGIDVNGQIRKKIKLENVINTEWEAISQDSNFIYIGDFGNNVYGNRKNLHILRVEKKSFLANKPVIDSISFSYSNQIDFSAQKTNTTNFDCEAFVVSQDSIYLFTKQWNQKKTSIYSLPKKPGNYSAQLKETIDVQGLITDASLTPKNEIVMCGYTTFFQPFIYLIADISNFNFSLANKRRFNFSLSFHQIEGISTFDGKLFYISNEAYIKKPIVNTLPQIHTVDLSLYLKN